MPTIDGDHKFTPTHPTYDELQAEVERLQARLIAEQVAEAGWMRDAKRAEAELARLREAGQRCMKISIGFAAAGIVGHVQILDVMGVALTPEVKP